MLRRASLAGLLAFAACAGRGDRPGGAVAGARVDGDFDEWPETTIVATNGRAVAGPDLREVRAAADEQALHLLFAFERPVNLQSMAATLRLAIDGDADASTGERVAALDGADLVVDMSVVPPGADAGAGMRLRLGGDTISRTVYEAGLTYAPTHASTHFEVAVARIVGDRALLPGRVLRGLVVMLDDVGAPVEVFGPFAVGAPPARAATPPERTLSLDRSAGTDVRVLVWNLGDDTPLQRPDPYRRILAAAAPDVVLFDELHPEIDAGRISALLPPERDWTVVIGEGGGRQRTAVASHFELARSPTLARVPWPDSVSALLALPMPAQVRGDLERAAEGVPALGALARVGPLRVVFVPVDLPCCGRAGSAEDRARIMAAAAVNEAIAEALAAGEAAAVVIGGDLNLVGSRTPLERLRARLDAGTDLRIAELVTPDRRTFSTWRAAGPFPPGRLDWLLYSGSELELAGGMILDAARLAPAARDSAGLQATDSEVTDHLPLVADFTVRAPRPTPGRLEPSKD